MKNGRPPTSHSMHSFLHQYTGSFKKPPLRRPHSVIGGSLGSFMAMPRNGSRLGNVSVFFFFFLTVGYVHSLVSPVCKSARLYYLVFSYKVTIKGIGERAENWEVLERQ